MRGCAGCDSVSRFDESGTCVMAGGACAYVRVIWTKESERDTERRGKPLPCLRCKKRYSH